MAAIPGSIITLVLQFVLFHFHLSNSLRIVYHFVSFHMISQLTEDAVTVKYF